MLKELEINVLKVQDNLLAAKVAQATAANSHHVFCPTFHIGDCIWLSTQNLPPRVQSARQEMHHKINAMLRWPLQDYSCSP